MNSVLDIFNHVNQMFGFGKRSQNQIIRPLTLPTNAMIIMPTLPEKRKDLSCPLLTRNFPVNINAGYMYPPLMNRSLHTLHQFPTPIPKIKPNYTPLRLTPRATLPGLKLPSFILSATSLAPLRSL